MTAKQKIIATGLSGMVGSRVAQLLSADYNFVDFSLDTHVDILDYPNLNNSFISHNDAKAVIHFAGFTDTNAAWLQRGDKTGLCYRLNVEGTKNILDLCQKHSKYLIYISTDFVFDGQKRGAYTENDDPNPIEWYGQTKYLGEKIILESGIPAAVTRIAFPYRADYQLKKDIVRKIIDGFRAGKLYPQWTDQLTTPTFVDDIAYGLKYLLTQKSTGIFHLVGSSSQSPYDLCQVIAEVFGFDKSIIQPSTLVGYQASQSPGSRPWQANLSLSNQKISELGIFMKTIKEGLATLKEQTS
ncbi:MAG: sugar nucleotide-binding protein [Candidatus Shapirobacteria bacterium]